MRAINIALLRSAKNRTRTARQRLDRAALIVFLFASAFGLHAQEQNNTQSTAGLRSEVIAPGIEHIQITRGYKSEKEATGPWLINMLRMDLPSGRRRSGPAMDKCTA